MASFVIRICKVCTFLFAVCTNLLAPMLLGMRAEFSLSLSQSGMLFLVFYAGNFIACAVCGRMLSVLGKRRALCVSMAGMAGLCLLVSLSPSFVLLCLLLCGVGFSTLVIQVSASSIAPELSSAGAASAVSGIQAYSGLGACGGLLLSGFLATMGIGWRACYFGFGMVAAAATLLCMLVHFPPLRQSDAGRPRDILKIVRNTALFPTFLCLMLYAGAETAVCSWLVTYLAEERGFSMFAGSAVTGIIWAAVFIGRIICAALVRRYAVKRILYALIPCIVLCVWLIPVLPDFGIWFGAAALGLALSGTWPLIASRLLNDSSSDGATALSIAFLFSFFGNTLVPYAIGAIAGATSLRFALLLDGGIFVLCLLAMVWSFRERKA